VADGLTEAQIIERLQRIERNVRLLADRAGVQIEDPSAEIDADIVELARSGRRMEAAKLYTERTGADFLSAQKLVNAL
jgi:hypothetical protein